MRISSAKWAGGELTLATSDPEAVRFALTFEPGDYAMTKAKKPRSKDANAMAWMLLDKIAAELRMSKEEVYRNTIRDIGGNTEMVCVKQEGLETLRRCWEKNGIGWQVETMPSKLPGCVNAVLYYGSSSYDTKQMSIFIDRLIQDCHALGLSTPDDDRIEALLEVWDAKQ